LPIRLAKLSSMKPRSKIGAITSWTAWCTTRSRKGAAETMRGFGSRMSMVT
jgi:hypothetical protein